MIDWALAARVADAVAGQGEPEPLPGDLDAMTARATAAVVAYTRLAPVAPLPRPEAVDRRAWSEANLGTMQATLAPLVDALIPSDSVMSGPLRRAAGVVLGAEVGGIVGFMGRNVLGQYELRLLDAEWPPRLLLVAPNVREASRKLEVDLEQLLQWVVFHEVTHGVQFGGVPWLRGHLASLLEELMSMLRVDVDPRALLKLPNARDVRALWEAVRDGGLVTAVAGSRGPQLQALLDRLQATMAVVEGHAEHTMDAAAGDALPTLPELRAALDRRRREKPPLLKLLDRLLGLDVKLRQYVVGKRFCDAVVRKAGIEGLNRAWSAPGQLPTLVELDDPTAWLARTERRAIPPAA